MSNDMTVAIPMYVLSVVTTIVLLYVIKTMIDDDPEKMEKLKKQKNEK